MSRHRGAELSGHGDSFRDVKDKELGSGGSGGYWSQTLAAGGCQAYFARNKGLCCVPN